MSSADPLTIARRIIEGPHRNSAAAREACRNGSWAALAQRTAPERPGLFGGRGDWSACVDLACRTFSGPKPVTVTIVPAWGCSTEDEEASTEWVEIHAVVVDAGEPYVAESGPWYDAADPKLSEIVVARASAYEVAWVVPTKSYAPSIELMLRRGKYGVLAARVIDLLDLSEVGYRESATASGALPRPTVEVPSFCQWVEPRVACSASLAAAIRKLAITTDGEGNLVERPRV